jgi:hypothetical protein
MGAVGQPRRLDPRSPSYYRLVADRSDRVMVREMGPSTLGNPFLVLFVSSPDNLARLDEIRDAERHHSPTRGATPTPKSSGR